MTQRNVTWRDVTRWQVTTLWHSRDVEPKSYISHCAFCIASSRDKLSCDLVCWRHEQENKFLRSKTNELKLCSELPFALVVSRGRKKQKIKFEIILDIIYPRNRCEYIIESDFIVVNIIQPKHRRLSEKWEIVGFSGSDNMRRARARSPAWPHRCVCAYSCAHSKICARACVHAEHNRRYTR